MGLKAFLLGCSSLYAMPATDIEAEMLSHIRQLTFEGRRAGEGYFSADGTRLIFQSERDNDNPFYQIYLMDLETGDVEQISPGIGKTTCAWIHPSSEKVLYASTHEDPQAQQKMQTELEFRAAGKERHYAWDYDPNFDLYAQDLKSGQRVNLTRIRGYDAEAAYSPDGQQIVFASNRRAYAESLNKEDAERFEHDKSFMMDLYLMDADGSNLKRLTDAPGYDGGPFFNADGSQITWRRFSLDGATAEIYTMDLASGIEQQITRTGVMSWAPYFHSSGEYLIYASNREGFANFELFIVDAEGRHEPVRVTHTDGFDGLPVFSPDGQRLSWTSKRGAGNKSQLFIADWNHAEARRKLGLDAMVSQQAMSESVDISTTEEAIRAEDARLHVERLAAEEMEGRLTGTAGEQRATEYVASFFSQIGLLPGGGDGSYFQSFPFTAGVKLAGQNQLQISGVENLGELVVNQDWRPLALSRSGPVDAADLVFAGYGIVAPGVDKLPDYDSYGDLDVAGKWVMVLRFQPESVSPEWRRHLVHYSDLAYKASVAKRLGALGLIVVTGPNAEARDRLVELKTDAASSSTSVAGIAISDELAAHLLNQSGKEMKQLQGELDKGEVSAGFSLKGVKVAATVDLAREQSQGRNVVGILKADDPTDNPPVILGAHVDHLGYGEGSGSLAKDSERGDVHYGADDNASGVAGLLESAQYLMGLMRQGKLNAKRDIWFIAWSGEELGTLGSSHFVEQLAGDSDLRGKVSAYLNMDMVGHLRHKVYLQGAGSSSIWSREIERRNVPVGLSITTSSDPYLPTDATPFYMKKVPVLNAFTGAHEDYSSPRDLPDQLNYAGIRDITRLMSGITRSLARADEAPDYLEVERKKSGLSRKHLRAYLGTIPAYGQADEIKGVKLQGAVKGGPAKKAGVHEGDILVGLAGVEIETIHDFMGALAGLKVGEKTTLTVLRGAEKIQLDVVPGSRE